MLGYVVERKGRFYAVIYEGLDQITGHERRRWHAAGTDRAAAERAAVLLAESAVTKDATRGLTVARFLLHTWLPRKQVSLRPSTWDGYRRNVELHVVPHIGRLPLRRLRGHHLDGLYAELLANGRDAKGGLDAKSVLEIHVILHRAMRDACRQGLVVRSVADDAEPPKRRRTTIRCALLERRATTGVPEDGEDRPALPRLLVGGQHRHASQRTARPAMRGRRPHERQPVDQSIAGVGVLRAARESRQDAQLAPMGRPRRGNGACTRALARSARDRARSRRRGRLRVLHTHRRANTSGSVHADLQQARPPAGVPRRLHDLRHTHATLLLKAGVPIKVVSERLGHATPGFTMATYQHVLPGMQAEAARPSPA